MSIEGKADVLTSPEAIAKAEVERLKAELNKKDAELAQKDIEIASLDEKLGQDHLTGLFNTRVFEKKTGSLVERVKKIKGPRHETIPPNEGMLIVLDLDDFKLINNYGHQVGDEALRIVAKRLKDVVKREEDAAFRIGGDEMAVWYEFNDATSISDEKLEEFFKKKKVEINDNLFIEIEIDEEGTKRKKRIPMTFAMGYSVLRRNQNTTVKELREAADQNQILDKTKEIKTARMKAAQEAVLE